MCRPHIPPLPFPLGPGAPVGSLRGTPNRAPNPPPPPPRSSTSPPSPAQATALTNGSGVYNTQAGGDPLTQLRRRGAGGLNTPRICPYFFPTSPARPGGFSQGDPSTFAFPAARSLLPPYLSFREAEAVCQLFSLCSYYIMVLLKGMFQSQ